VFERLLGGGVDEPDDGVCFMWDNYFYSVSVVVSVR
jgi:hypothetical protein